MHNLIIYFVKLAVFHISLHNTDLFLADVGDCDKKVIICCVSYLVGRFLVREVRSYRVIL